MTLIDIWTWTYPHDSPSLRRRLTAPAIWIAVAVAALVWAVVSAGSGSSSGVRIAVVIAVMSVFMAVLNEKLTRQALSTTITVNRDGELTFSDNRETSGFNLGRASEPSLRLRSGTGMIRQAWSLETVTPEGAWNRRITPVAGHFSLDEDEIRALERELARLHHRFSAGGDAAPEEASEPPTEAGVTTPTPVGATNPPSSNSGAGAVGAQPLVWSIDALPSAERNRRRLRVGTAVVVLAVAAFAAASSWSDGLGAVLLSMFVPALLALVGFGLDRAYNMGRSFRLTAGGSGLKATRGSKTLAEVPRGDIRSVSVNSKTSSYASSGTSVTHRTLVWMVHVDTGAEEPVSVGLPTQGLGVKFDTNEAVKLEADLRRALNL